MSDQPFKGFNITSDPDLTSISQPGKDPARETSHLPLRLVHVANLQPQFSIEDWSGESMVRRIDRHSFEEVMADMAPGVSIEVENKIASSPRLLDVDLLFKSLDDFHPERVAGQVPALAQLLQIRISVDQVKSGAIDVDTFRSRLADAGADPDWAEQLYQTLILPPDAPASSSGASSVGGDDALNRLLGLVSLGNGEASAPVAPPDPSQGTGSGGLMDALIGAVAGDAEPTEKVAKSAADQLLRDLDGILNAQVNTIMGHPAFREVESSWRGLKFLVDRINFRRNVLLEVLAANKESLAAALYYQVLLPEHQGNGDSVPLSAVILDHEFDHTNADVALLEDLADTGASLQVPVIASASASFFDVNNYSGLVNMPPLWQQFEGPSYIEWNKLREKKEAKHLALALPSFVLRNSYSEKNPVKSFQFSEEGTLFGRAAVAVATRIAKSFTDTGWPTHLTGGSESSIQDLPIWNSRQGHIPLAVLVPDSKQSEFAKGGFVLLNGRQNHDSAMVTRAMTACKPEVYENLMAATEAREHVTLACQLFVARAAQYVLALQDVVEPNSDIEALTREIDARMRAFLHTANHSVPREAVEIEYVPESGMPNHELFAIRLRPPSYILRRGVSLVMGVQVAKEEVA